MLAFRYIGLVKIRVAIYVAQLAESFKFQFVLTAAILAQFNGARFNNGFKMCQTIFDYSIFFTHMSKGLRSQPPIA